MKGQVSLEYLSTYSWAIIILLTIVSTLTYFGFFSQRTFVEDSCDSGTFLMCEDSLLERNGNQVELTLKLRNNMEDDIVLTRQIELIEYGISSCAGGWPGLIIPRGETRDTPACVVDADMRKGDIEELSYVIKYKRYPFNVNTPEHELNGGLKSMVTEQ